MQKVIACPVATSLKYIGKKWTLNIIRDLFMGKRRFNDFLKSNPDLSTKMLSERLKELEENKIVLKNVVSTSPILIEYSLTQKGRSLNKVLYELSIFSMKEYADETLESQECMDECKLSAKEMFGI